MSEEFNDEEDIELCMPCAKTPFGIGNESFPLREDILEPLTRGTKLEELARRWAKSNGAVIMPDISLPELPNNELTCEQVLGIGRCRQKVSADRKERHARLHAWLKKQVNMMQD